MVQVWCYNMRRELRNGEIDYADNIMRNLTQEVNSTMLEDPSRSWPLEPHEDGISDA